MRPRIGWSIFALAVLAFVFVISSMGEVFLLNHTQSMPIGIYVKRESDKLEIGDMIVFHKMENRTDLIKYIAAINPAEVCVDDREALWIDGSAVAQRNIEKYPSAVPDQSRCHQLLADEILVIGDHPDSYDSRYFGPIKRADVIARVELIWQIKSHHDAKH